MFGCRFIPTYMGNADLPGLSCDGVPVHPHVHGERTIKVVMSATFPGSSPRTWGTPFRCPRVIRDWRFIPTYMGNARSEPQHSRNCPVHPHVHGERLRFCALESSGLGSSPRTWGTLEGASPYVAVVRFIPTYMGNARRRPVRRSWRPVHPHVHGERCKQVVGAGTSARFIPTYMGNASRIIATYIEFTVHPHVHGERRRNFYPIIASAGSSPRTWGTLDEFSLNSLENRFIPTYMGNARFRLGHPVTLTVHPHVHGERKAFPSRDSLFAGSSPRTWGTLQRN